VFKYILSTTDALSYWFLVFVPGKSASSNCPSGNENLLNTRLAYRVPFVWRDMERTCFHLLLAYLLDKICSFPPHSLQTILGLPSLEEVLQPTQIVPEYVIYNMTNTSKHGVVILQNKSGKISFFFLVLLKASVWCNCNKH